MTINIGLIILLIIMTLMGAYAGLCLKKASAELENSVIGILKNYNFYLGGFLYVGSAVINIILLGHMNYSVVLPLTSITYVWTMILSTLFLKERMSWSKVVGVTLIVIGAIIIVL